MNNHPSLYYNGAEYKPDSEGKYNVNIKAGDAYFTGPQGSKQMLQKSIEIAARGEFEKLHKRVTGGISASTCEPYDYEFSQDGFYLDDEVQTCFVIFSALRGQYNKCNITVKE